MNHLNKLQPKNPGIVERKVMEENSKSEQLLGKIAERIQRDIRSYGAALLVVVVFYFLMHVLFQAFCPMVVLTGFPCPGCGLTRSVLFFLTGQWERSFYIHPMGGIVLFFLCYCAWFRYIKGKKIPGLNWILAFLVGTAVVLFLIRMRLYFPNRPPYTYTSGNLLEKIIPGYGMG